MKEICRLKFPCRFQIVPAIALAILLCTPSVAQDESSGILSQQTIESPVKYFHKARNQIIEVQSALAYLYGIIRTELSHAEGDYLADRWDSIMQRYQSDLTPRILWQLIALLTISGFIFCSSVAYGLLTWRKKPKSRLQVISSKPTGKSGKNLFDDKQREKLSSTPPRHTIPTSMIGKLKAGMLDAVEEMLLAERRSQPADTTVVMYLLACRAARGDPAVYNSMIKDLFPKGLDNNIQLCLHAAQIGRILSPKIYPSHKYPEPMKTFEVESELIGDSLGSISEFGDVHTLLHLVRVYVDMEEIAETKHLIVEILVRGDRDQRTKALEFAKLVNRKSSAG